jgi:hypothetical protein
MFKVKPFRLKIFTIGNFIVKIVTVAIYSVKFLTIENSIPKTIHYHFYYNSSIVKYLTVLHYNIVK